MNVTGLIQRQAAACERHDFLEVHSQWMPGSNRMHRARRHAWADRQRNFRGTWMELGQRGIVRGLFAPTNAPGNIAMSLRRYLTGGRTSYLRLDQPVCASLRLCGSSSAAPILPPRPGIEPEDDSGPLTGSGALNTGGAASQSTGGLENPRSQKGTR